MKNLDFFGFFSVKFFLNSARDFMDFWIVGRDFMDFWIVGNHIMKCMVHHQIIDIECTAYRTELTRRFKRRFKRDLVKK